jgi:predicted tellurium resistance membrane protein TerC
MNRFTWIVWLGGGLLGYVAGEMLIDDPVVQRWLGAGAPVLHYVVPIGIGVVVTALGCWVGRGRRHAHVPENL